MQRKWSNNLPLKFLSVGIAFLLWLVVITIENPMDEKSFSNIPVTIINESAITGKGKVYKVEKNSDVIDVVVRAPRDVLNKIKAEDFTATADMERNLKYDSQISISVTCKKWEKSIDTIKKSSENVIISIEDSMTEQFPVKVETTGTAGTGYTAGVLTPEQSVLEITGPASIVEQIKKVVVEVDVTGKVLDFEEVCPLKVLDSENNPVDITNLKYNGKTEGMMVSVTMFRKKTVGISFDVSGQPAEGYQYTGITYVPEVIEVSGTASALSGLRNIDVPAEALLLEGATESFQQNVDISQYLPEGVYLVDEADKTIVVMITIEPLEEREFEIPVSDITVENQPENLELSYESGDSVAVSVRGTEEELNHLQSSQIAVALDLSSCRRAGTYELPLQVTVPENYSTGKETKVQVELRR